MTGSDPKYFSHSTTVTWPQQPCASRDVPTSRVSTFGLPWTQSGCAAAPRSGSYQAPVDNCSTPGMTSSVTAAAARHAPRSLNRRTMSPSAIPRCAASIGLRRTTSRPAIFLRLAVGTEVELTVQPGRRLVGDQRQRVARTWRLGRRQPCRVRRAIVVIEAGDGVRIDLDSAAWRRQFVVEGIVAEGAQKAAVIGG